MVALPLLCRCADSNCGGCVQSTFQRTMDLVQRLCEASTNLVKIFPHDDRPVRYERRTARFRAGRGSSC